LKDCKKFIIFYAWGRRNSGDHALILGALDLLSSLIDLSYVVVVNRFSEEMGSQCPTSEIRRYFPKVEVVSSPFDLTNKIGVQRLIQYFKGVILSVVSVVFPKVFMKRAIKTHRFWAALFSARIVLLNGGNLFFWHKIRRNLPRIIALALPLMLAKRLGIPYAMLPQTCGPFEGVVSRLIGMIFESALFITFRDSDSKKRAESIASFEENSCAELPDLAFYLTPKHQDTDRDILKVYGLRPGTYFCVSLRTDRLGSDVKLSKDNPEVTEKKILAVFPQTMRDFEVITGLKSVIVIQVDTDRPISEKVGEILQNMRVDHSILEINDPYEYLNLYHDARFLLSFRLHSIIFALTQGTPVLGIWRTPLGTKIPSMMHDMELGEYVIELDDANIGNLLDYMLKIHSQREELSNNIITKVADRKNSARKFFKKLLTDMTEQFNSTTS